MEDQLVATHFLRNAPDGTGESDGNAMELRVDRYSVLEGTVQLIGSTFMGLTVQCARCHDHKFEPFTQQDYYQLQAILRPGYDPDQWLKPNQRLMTTGTRAERDKVQQAVERTEREIKATRESIEGLTKPFRKLIQTENLQSLPEADRKKVQAALDAKEKDRNKEMKELLKKHEALVDIKDEALLKRFPELADGLHKLEKSLRNAKETNRSRFRNYRCLWKTERTSRRRILHSCAAITRSRDTKCLRVFRVCCNVRIIHMKLSRRKAALGGGWPWRTGSHRPIIPSLGGSWSIVFGSTISEQGLSAHRKILV